MAADLDFVLDLASGFFAEKRIRETLFIIDETEVTGWEKWLQIELAKYCNSRSDIKTWGREARYELDRRSSARSTASIDFVVHQKHKQSPLALEIKQAKSARGCIRAMIKDKQKLWSIKWSKDDLRSVWCLGVHLQADAGHVRHVVDLLAKELRFEVDLATVRTEAIGRTPFSFTIFT
jgi:hypothetical protein